MQHNFSNLDTVVRVALVGDGVVKNIIRSNGKFVLENLTGFTDAVDLTGIVACDIGWSYTGGAFVPPTPNIVEIVSEKIRAAKVFADGLMVELGTENVLSGKSVAEIATISEKLKDIQLLGQSGSLYTMEAKMGELVPDALLTEALIKKYRNKVRDYLALPLLP